MEKKNRESKRDIRDKDIKPPGEFALKKEAPEDKPLSLWPLTMDQAVRIALTAPPMPKREKNKKQG